MTKSDQANRPGPQHGDSWIAQQWGKAADMAQEFINSKYSKELSRLRAHQEAKKNAPAQLDRLERDAEDARVRYELAKRILEPLANADFARSAWDWHRNNVQSIKLAMHELTAAYVLKQFAPELLKIGGAEVESAEKILETFRQENAALLKEIQQDYERAAAAQAEEDERQTEMQRKRMEEKAPEVLAEEARRNEQIRLNAIWHEERALAAHK